MRFWEVVVLMVMASVSLVAPQAEMQDQVSQEAALQEDDKGTLALDDRNRFFGTFQTSTRSLVSLITSTVFFSCLSGTATASVCTGRRRRRALSMDKPKSLIVDPNEWSALTSSGDGSDVTTDAADTEANEKLFGIQVWTISTTSTSVTVFYTDSRTTIRLSYYCVAAGMSLPIRRCGGAR
nr:uncharacterized protein LOC128690032 [Cherax quadricarinatus]